MGKGTYDYDSAAVIREARKFKRCYEALDADALPNMERARAQLEGNFEGQAAAALEARLSEMLNEIRTLRGSCSGMYSALMDFAEALERADEQVAQLMGGN